LLIDKNMSNDYTRSVIRGMTVGHILLGLAGGAAVVLFALLAYTQWRALVVWFPVVMLAIFTVMTMVLLQKDAKSSGRGQGR